MNDLLDRTQIPPDQNTKERAPVFKNKSQYSYIEITKMNIRGMEQGVGGAASRSLLCAIIFLISINIMCIGWIQIMSISVIRKVSRVTIPHYIIFSCSGPIIMINTALDYLLVTNMTKYVTRPIPLNL